jgi:hypothetical protein
MNLKISEVSITKRNSATVIENKYRKSYRYPGYNYDFNKINGYFERWGFTYEDDPIYSECGPEILDIEITDICNGPGGVPCPFCYKANTPNGKNMSFDTFRTILDNISQTKTLTQCAFGVDAQAESNPDLWKMMEYCRNHPKNPIIPNITVADISNETADKLVKYCGACAVSAYQVDKNLCYNSVKKLTDRGMKQVNIHCMISKETLQFTYSVLNDIKHDKRLIGLNAIVFLSLKQKGRGINHNPLSKTDFQFLIDFCLENNISFGFDSCSAKKFENSIKGHEKEKEFLQLSEPCESGIFSFYINVDGKFFPCSFAEGERDWKKGIDCTVNINFLEDIWYNKRVKNFRKKLLKCNRHCPIYNI